MRRRRHGSDLQPARRHQRRRRQILVSPQAALDNGLPPPARDGQRPVSAPWRGSRPCPGASITGVCRRWTRPSPARRLRRSNASLVRGEDAAGHGGEPVTARLNGLCNPNGAATAAWFQWGATTNYDQTTPRPNSWQWNQPASAELRDHRMASNLSLPHRFDQRPRLGRWGRHFSSPMQLERPGVVTLAGDGHYLRLAQRCRARPIPRERDTAGLV